MACMVVRAEQGAAAMSAFVRGSPVGGDAAGAVECCEAAASLERRGAAAAAFISAATTPNSGDKDPEEAAPAAGKGGKGAKGAKGGKGGTATDETNTVAIDTGSYFAGSGKFFAAFSGKTSNAILSPSDLKRRRSGPTVSDVTVPP